MKPSRESETDSAFDLPPDRAGEKPERRGVSARARWNFLLDALLLVLFGGLCWVSVVLRFVFPSPGNAAGWTLWGFRYDDWAAWQFNLVALLAGLFLLHVMLHWSWVCHIAAEMLSRLRGQRFRPDDGARTLYGVGLLVVCLGSIALLTAWASIALQRPGP